MKRILLSLVAIVITSVCFAQDVIVKKDGSTIQAKVLEISQTEVKYKNFSNQNGPTYTISTRDLQCINYENGSRDRFQLENYNPNIVTNETATQFSNDIELIKKYGDNIASQKKIKTLKLVSYTVGPVLAIGGSVLCIVHACSQDTDLAGPYIIGAGLCAAGIGTSLGCFLSAKHLEKESQFSVQSSPLYRQEFRIGKKERLMVGADLLKDNTFKHQTVGLGFAYNF